MERIFYDVLNKLENPDDIDDEAIEKINEEIIAFFDELEMMIETDDEKLAVLETPNYDFSQWKVANNKFNDLIKNKKITLSSDAIKKLK